METMKAVEQEAKQVLKNTEHKEGSTTKAIEDQTAKLPSTFYLSAAIVAMGASLALKMMGRKHTALFVGQWVAPFLLFGIYNKMVKQAGHDKESDHHLVESMASVK